MPRTRIRFTFWPGWFWPTGTARRVVRPRRGGPLVVLHQSCDNGSYERMREKLLGEVGIAVIRENLLREGPCDVAMQKSLITSRPVFHNSVFLNPSSVPTSREMCSTTRAMPWATVMMAFGQVAWTPKGATSKSVSDGTASYLAVSRKQRNRLFLGSLP